MLGLGNELQVEVDVGVGLNSVAAYELLHDELDATLAEAVPVVRNFREILSFVVVGLARLVIASFKAQGSTKTILLDKVGGLVWILLLD